MLALPEQQLEAHFSGRLVMAIRAKQRAPRLVIGERKQPEALSVMLSNTV